MSGIMTAMKANPIIAAVTAFVALAGVITVVASNVETTAMKYKKAIDAMEESQDKIDETKKLQEELRMAFSNTSNDTQSTASETKKYNSVLSRLAEVSPKAKRTVQELKDGLLSQAEAARILKQELDGVIENENKVSAIQAASALRNKEKPFSSDYESRLNLLTGLGLGKDEDFNMDVLEDVIFSSGGNNIWKRGLSLGGSLNDYEGIVLGVVNDVINQLYPDFNP